MQVIQLYICCKNQANPVNVATLSPSSLLCNHSKLFVLNAVRKSQNFITLEVKTRKNIEILTSTIDAIINAQLPFSKEAFFILNLRERLRFVHIYYIGVHAFRHIWTIWGITFNHFNPGTNKYFIDKKQKPKLSSQAKNELSSLLFC